jgi:hypothetical protein
VRDVGARLGLFALLLQIAILPLHAWEIAREEAPPPSAGSVHGRLIGTDALAPRLATTVRWHEHDCSTCPICQTLLQVRYLAAAPGPHAVAAPPPPFGERDVAQPDLASSFSSLAAPRAPPRAV